MAAAGLPLWSLAQQRGSPTIGFITPYSPGESEARAPFLEGLRELGYVEGKSIQIHWRYADRKQDRLRALADDLVSRHVSVIVAETTAAVRAAKQATQAIPIVMAAVADAVGSGLVESLAKPGGNVTGASFLGTELVAKRLELLKEVVAGMSRVLVLGHPGAHGASTYREMREETLVAAQALRLEAHFFEAPDPRDFQNVFRQMANEPSSAVLVWPSPIFLAERRQLVALAEKHKLPAIYYLKEYAKVGGLLSYGPSLPELFRRSAGYVDRILKGTRPSDMPVQQPTKFELVINVAAARRLGLAVPRTVLLRADETIS